MKKIAALLLFTALLLSGCGNRQQLYQTVFLDVFDTVTNLRGFAASEQEFNEIAEAVHTELLEYHRLFDIYHDTPMGIKQVNDSAGLSPVAVDEQLMALLIDCRDYYELTDGKMNVAMGSVLSLWHEARESGLENPENAALPDPALLREASEHIRFDTVILDEDNMTVYLTDPQQSLDLGAIAKGWAAQQISAILPEGYLLNLGGNTCARGSKPDGSSWVIGVQSPTGQEAYLCTVGITNCSAVTSGDYQRYYTVDGKKYHHIIDPDTLMPAEFWTSVTILFPDSGLADCLSTALFVLPLEEGKALAQKVGAEVLWVDTEGNRFETEGFRKAMQ